MQRQLIIYSTIVPTTVNFDSDDDMSVTAPAPLSSSGPTRTSQPEAPPSDRTRTSQPARPIATIPTPPSRAPQVRDEQRYDVLGEHGRGGLGRVSRVHDRELGRDIAIKELISGGPLSEVRFLREALITARLEHPGIVPVYEAGRWPDGTPFYAMKLVAGRPLRALIAERTTIEERIGLLHHVIAVADAIAYAHGRNIIHRDLKPANIIVGEFGETVVIDWGLAKDLSAIDGPGTTAIVSSLNDTRDDGLTSAGAILGTPAYMAPEQARGEPVDQRADVFAIGAMLWELCSLQKLPPGYSGQRRRILRRASIDPDLVTIIEKALDPDPVHRYADAGALAADLKAFKAGARIAARRYSPLALFTHWTRRHRVLATSLVAVIVLTVVVSVVYVRSVTAERDRADAALGRAEDANSRLVLEHANLLLRSDPTAALTTLGTYHGSDSMRFSELLAEARGRGVARSVLHPHNDTIWFVAGQPDGSLISVGEDHRIQRTVDSTTTNLASDVSYTVHVAYSPRRRVLAYATTPTGIALMELARPDATRLDAMSPIAMAFNPDGSRLAALDKRGTVVIWDTVAIPKVIHRSTLPGATELIFTRLGSLVVLRPGSLIELDAERSRSNVYNESVETVDGTEGYLVAGLTNGKLALLSPTFQVQASIPVCKQRLRKVVIAPRRSLIAFGCDEGRGGVVHLDPAKHTLEVIDTFNTTASVWLLTIDHAESHALAVSERTAYIYDFDSRMTRQLEGQPSLISSIATPTDGFPYLVTGDVNGTVRIWDRPSPSARVLSRVPGLPFAFRYSPDSSMVAIYGSDPVVRLIRLVDGSTRELRGHTDMIGSVHFSHDGKLVITSSWDTTARVWRTSDGSLLKRFDTHRAIVENSDFLDNGDTAISIGDDGHLFAWSVGDDTIRAFLTNSTPLKSLQVIAGTRDIVVSDTAGSIWTITRHGDVRQLRQGNQTAIMFMRASPSGRYLGIGQEDGTVIVYYTSNWSIATSVQTGGTVARIEFDPQNRDFLVLTEDGFVHLLPLPESRVRPWNKLQVQAHDIDYDASGDTISISGLDGGSWFFSFLQSQWSYHRDHLTEVWSGQFSPDGQVFVSVDQHGLATIRKSSKIFIRPSSN